MKRDSIKPTRHDQAEHTREIILHAASREFRLHGFDGASTAAITEAAEVQASLLYYYFKNKLGLYKAVVLSAIEEVAERAIEGLSSSGTAGERLLRAVALHFDRFVTHPEAMSLMQQEVLRGSDRADEVLGALEAGILRPTIAKFEKTIVEGLEPASCEKLIGFERSVRFLAQMRITFSPRRFSRLH